MPHERLYVTLAELSDGEQPERVAEVVKAERPQFRGLLRAR